MTITRKENAQNALIGAFMRGDLKHMNSCACAVGNLAGGTKEAYVLARSKGTAGYNFAHIIRIERAFEFIKNLTQNVDLINADQDGFLGLTAVFDVLETIDPEECEEAVNLLEMIEA